MKEDIAKKLIQKSTIKTSEDFTDKLLLQIEAEKATVSHSDIKHIQMFRYAIFGIIGFSTIFFLSMYFDFLPKLNIVNVQLKISKTPLLITTTLLLLLATNNILKMQHMLKATLK